MTPAAERRPLLPFAWARAHHLVLLSDGECCEALCRPDTAARALLEARRLADGPMRVSRLAPEAFEKVLVLSYQRDSAEAHRMMADIGNELDLYTLAEELPDTDDLLDSEDDAPIIRLINAMLTEAIKEKASDIHIETYERHLQIRFRVDGVLREILRPQRRLAALLDRVDALIARPHGIILVTGPTGSGKSTTLYAALSRLDARERNIMTIEDPVEYELEGIGQTQVNAKVEMTFARGLRAILRQDPDVVLVGEIRDGETAQIAVQASLTGHLVLSTLHTNSALGAISRLQDMGVEPFLLSTSLLAVMSQRLVRQLCPHCRQPWQADANTARQMAVPVGARLWQPKGCPECNFIGYRGRTGIHELLLVDDRVRAAIHRGENEITLIQQLGPAWQTLRHAGRDKALAGITSWEEVMRVTEQQTTESV
ncbi:GspE/PulE family protein [Klebsiella pneumoniae]|uniref:GspE/PulE family protein n=1 Tax=Klebsiella pneumoniae TaxID=573 RepID=UPI001330F65C|nr:ATPase, T2SS/T4P/T4SS family [Klebsiella pneumoniae]